MNSTTPAWVTEITGMNATDEVLVGSCFNVSFNLNLLIIIIVPFGLVVNAMVLWLLGLRMHRNAFLVYILNLAWADFLFLSVFMAESLENLINFNTEEKILTSEFINIASNLAYVAGLGILSAVSTERCLSVLFPIWYRYHRPRHLSVVMCILLWALSLLVSILEGIYCGFLYTELNYKWCQVFDFLTVGWLIFLCVVLSGSSLALVAKIFCISRCIGLTNLYMVILLTVLAFLLCGLPFGIYWFLLIWIGNHSEPLFCNLYSVSVVLSAINSSINPIIYFLVGFFRKRQWRCQWQTLRLVLQGALQDTPEVDKHGGNVQQEALEMTRSSLV